tara:strand:+ start:1877 stop:2272 length:396 start_codon:yes stop_codon:yes gene_type:complete
MVANIPHPQKSIYTEINIGKFKTTRHYDLIQPNETAPTELINIVTDRQFAKSLPNYWLSYRESNKWKRITGLFKVDGTKYHKGDKGRNNVKEHLILVYIDKETRTVILYTFIGYYSSDPTRAIQLIENNNL